MENRVIQIPIAEAIYEVVTNGIGYRECPGNYSESLKEDVSPEYVRTHLGVLDAIVAKESERDDLFKEVLQLKEQERNSKISEVPERRVFSSLSEVEL